VPDRIVALKGKLEHQKDRDRPGFLVDENLNMEDVGESSYREVHIRLHESAAKSEETLYPLLDYLQDHGGPCSVFIHVPVTGGESVIRTTTQIGASADTEQMDSLTGCSGVADAWRL
jgi:hypothetical protein